MGKETQNHEPVSDRWRLQVEGSTGTPVRPSCRSRRGILHPRRRFINRKSSLLLGSCRRIRDDAAAAGTHRFTEEPVPALLPTGGHPSPANPSFPAPVLEIIPL